MKKVVQTLPRDHTAFRIVVVSTVLKSLCTPCLCAVNPGSRLSLVILSPLAYLNISCYCGNFTSREWTISVIERNLSLL